MPSTFTPPSAPPPGPFDPVPATDEFRPRTGSRYGPPDHPQEHLTVGWGFQTGDATTEAVSQPGNYGFADGAGINGGVGGGPGYEPRALLYVGVPDVEAAVRKAESLGGTRRMGPEGSPGTLAVAHFTDPEGNLVGLAGPA